MSITRNSLKRPAALFAAAAVLVGAAVPALLATSASAVQLTNRSIQLSDSAPSSNTDITSGIGSGTNVNYKVTFTPSASFQSIVIDFCSNSPLISDSTCTAPTGLSTAGAPATIGAWTVTKTANQLKLSAAALQGTAATPYSFEVTGMQNPSTLGSFYARITTYSTQIPGYVNPSNPGPYLDYGGIAMSTTRPILITAKVMETMTLCTSAAAFTGTSCAGQTAPSISIGGGANNDVIDYNAIYTRPAYSQISTNASNGYAIYMRAHNTCGGGLSKDGGTTCEIPAINAGGSTAINMVAGTAAFGATVGDGTAVSGGLGANAAVTRWKTTAPQYLMDETSATDNVKYVYGSKVIETGITNKQANGVGNTYTFAATASPTTPAGIYTQAFTLIAVGIF